MLTRSLPVLSSGNLCGPEGYTVAWPPPTFPRTPSPLPSPCAESKAIKSRKCRRGLDQIVEQSYCVIALYHVFIEIVPYRKSNFFSPKEKLTIHNSQPGLPRSRWPWQSSAVGAAPTGYSQAKKRINPLYCTPNIDNL